MGILFEAIDPNGITIYCEKAQWENHVIMGHPNMSDNISAIIETISQPDVIYESHDSDPPEYRQLYCKHTKNATYSSKVPYTKVIAYIGGGMGN